MGGGGVNIGNLPLHLPTTSKSQVTLESVGFNSGLHLCWSLPAPEDGHYIADDLVLLVHGQVGGLGPLGQRTQAALIQSTEGGCKTTVAQRADNHTAELYGLGCVCAYMGNTWGNEKGDWSWKLEQPKVEEIIGTIGNGRINRE